MYQHNGVHYKSGYTGTTLRVATQCNRNVVKSWPYYILSFPLHLCVICNLGFNVLWFNLNTIQEFTVRSQPNYLFSISILTFALNQREGVCTNTYPRFIMTPSSSTNYWLPIHFSIFKYWPAASFWTVSLKGGKY